MTQETIAMFLLILPEIGLVVLATLVFALDALWRDERRARLGWITTVGLVVIAVLAAVFSRPDKPSLAWGGMLAFDNVGFVFRMIFLVGAALTSMFALESDSLREKGEFYGLMLISTLGMSLMASAADLIMLYLAVETTSIPLYVLAGFSFRDDKSVESGIKYLLFGAMTSAIMLFGFSWLYGLSGTTSLYAMSGKLTASGAPLFLVLMVIVFVLAGFGFKVSAVPFHFWAPDVYEGAPTPVAGFLSTASKAAGFAVLMRVMTIAFAGQQLAPYWTLMIAILATASMFVGNLLALTQKNIKRLLAYSSIAQAGYILIGVAANSQLGTTGAVYYLMSYLLTNLAAFGIVTLIGKLLGSDEISAYGGLSRRSPALAMALLVALLSLGGIPPFSGFFGKVLVIAAAMQNPSLVWLAIIGVINSVIGLYYYLVVVKATYLYRTDGDDQPLKVAATAKVALVIAVAGVVILGVVLSPFYTYASQVATSLGL